MSASMTASETHTLSTAELQAALRIAGIPPSRNSPLAELPPPAVVAPAVVSSLRALGVMSAGSAVAPQWIEVLSAIANPAHNVFLCLGSSTSWNAIGYFAGASGMAGYSTSDGNHHITFPCSADSVLRSLSDWFAPASVPALPPFQTDLQPEELTAVAALVDAYREENLRALLERRPPNASRFSREQLVYQLQAAASGDPRWFASLLAKHAPAPFAPYADGLDAGIRALAARRWVRFEDSQAVLEPPLITVSVGLGILNPYAVIGTGPVGEPASVALATCSLQGFWALSFVAGAVESYARLEGLGGPGLSAWLESKLEALPQPAPQASWNDPIPAAALAATAAPVRQAARLPIPVPVPIPAAEPNCGRCGKPKQPGRPFCTGCGAPTP